MKPSFLAFFLGILISSVTQGQFLNPPETENYDHYQKFSSEFIREKGIEELMVNHFIKPDGKKIQNLSSQEKYVFDKKGRLISYVRISKKTDTLITTYRFVSDRLNCEINSEGSGIYNYCYTYGPDGLPSSIKYGTNDDSGYIKTEDLKHKNYGNQLHTTIYNTSGRPFIKEFRYMDESNRLVKWRQSYVMTRKTQEEEYTYDSKGRFNSKRFILNGINMETVLNYDEKGRISEYRFFRNNELAERKEVVYRDTGLIDAELTRDEKKGSIEIARYEYRLRY